MLPSRTRCHWFRANEGTMSTNSKDILDRIYQLDPHAELSPRERTQLFTTLSSPKCLIQSYLEMFSCNSSVNLGTEAINSKSTLKRIFELGPEAQLSSRDRQELYQAMSPSCLIPAFFETSTLDSGEEYDHFWMDSLNKTFLPLKSNSILLEEVAKVIIKHLEGELMVNPLWKNFGTELLPIIPILLECPVCDKPDETSGRKIIDRIARTMIKMKGEAEENFDKIVCWWRRHANLLDRVVRVFLQAFKSQNKKEGYVKIDGPFLDVLKIIYEVNKSLGFKLAVDQFYLGQVEDEEFVRKLRDHLLQLHDHKLKTSEHSLQLRLLDFPFLLDVPVKWKILSLNFSHQQETKKHSRLMETLFRPIQVRIDEKQLRLRFAIDDDREKTVESAISNISCRTQESLLLPLEVHFKTDVSLGVNAGGPMKEFFSRLFEELFNLDKHSVFKKLEDSPTCTTYWFNKKFKEMEKLKWIGKLFALMFYNKVIITLPFPLLFYKKLLEKSKSNFEDLKLLDPSMAKSMEELLRMEDDELSFFSFTVNGTEDEPEIELKPGGKDEVVTTANVREYLELYARHYTAASHFDVFSEGFRSMLSRFTLHKRFTPHELMSLFQGGEYDWKAFQQSFSKHDDPNSYPPEHPVVKMFWSVFHDDLNEKQKRDFLRFLTGADHVPLGGFREIGPRIWPLGGYHECKGKPPKDICPEVNTCTGFVVLHLPMYSQREHLKERLLKLLEMKDHGFHKPVA